MVLYYFLIGFKIVSKEYYIEGPFSIRVRVLEYT